MVLRRTARDAQEWGPEELAHGDIAVNLRHRAVYVGGTPVRLTPTEFRLLVLLMREPDRVFTREQVIDRVFGHDFDGFNRTVDAHVSNLRHKLESDAERPRHIHTIYGVGYRFGDE